MVGVRRRGWRYGRGEHQVKPHQMVGMYGMEGAEERREVEEVQAKERWPEYEESLNRRR